MNSAREPIMAALFADLSAKLVVAPGTPFTNADAVFSRRLRLFNKVGPEGCPAFFLVDHKETLEHNVLGLPLKSTFMAEAWFYFISSDDNIGSTTLNNILDALDWALRGDMVMHQYTLGGLVKGVYVNGETFKDPGDLDNYGMAIVPLNILVP